MPKLKRFKDSLAARPTSAQVRFIRNKLGLDVSETSITCEEADECERALTFGDCPAERARWEDFIRERTLTINEVEEQLEEGESVRKSVPNPEGFTSDFPEPIRGESMEEYRERKARWREWKETGKIPRLTQELTVPNRVYPVKNNRKIIGKVEACITRAGAKTVQLEYGTNGFNTTTYRIRTPKPIRVCVG